MTFLVIDTCVWLDIAKDPHMQKLLGVLDDLIMENEVTLVVPQVTIDEFNRNKTRIIEETRKSIVGNVKRVKEVIAKFGEENHKEIMINQLNDLTHKAPLMGEFAAQGSVKWVDGHLNKARVAVSTDEILLKAASRAVLKRAPFHLNKNSMADAIIIEIYAQLVSTEKSKGARFAFVTSNKEDFSESNGNKKLPHDHLKPLFSARKSKIGRAHV